MDLLDKFIVARERQSSIFKNVGFKGKLGFTIKTENDTRSGRRSLCKREGKTYVEDNLTLCLTKINPDPFI